MGTGEFPSKCNDEKQQLFLATGSGEVRAAVPTGTTAKTTTETTRTWKNNRTTTNTSSQQQQKQGGAGEQHFRKGRHQRKPRPITPTPGAFRIDATGAILSTESSSSANIFFNHQQHQQSVAGQEEATLGGGGGDQSPANSSSSTITTGNNRQAPLVSKNSDDPTETDRDDDYYYDDDNDDIESHPPKLLVDDDENDIQQLRPMASISLIEATEVNEDDDDNGNIDKFPKTAVAMAEEDSLWAFWKRSRCAQCCVFFGCFAIMGLALGVSLVFFNQSIANMDGGETVEQFFFDLVGTPVDGNLAAATFGSSLSMSVDGTRMAVADSRNVYVYDLVAVNDTNNEWKRTGTVEAPIGATLGIALNHEVIRNAAQVVVSRDGAVMAVGWPYSTNADGLEAGTGRVQVFYMSSSSSDNGVGGWEPLGNTLYGVASEDFFGTSVSLSANGSILAVASPVGRADIFRLNKDVWMPQGELSSSLMLEGTLAVGSVSISTDGQVLAVGGQPNYGQQQEEDEVLVSPAVVRIFRFVAGNWIELGDGIVGNIMEDDTAYITALSGDGTVVAVSNYYTTGEIRASSVEGEKMNDALDVRVFEWNFESTSWVQMGENLHAFAPGEKSGYFIALSDDGKVMGMGDPGRRSEEGGGVAGHVHVFKYNNNDDNNGAVWKQIGPNRDGDASGDQFGSAVALGGRHLAASAPFNRGEGVELGRVYVFDVYDDL